MKKQLRIIPVIFFLILIAYIANNSTMIHATHSYTGKYVSILGDSISTYTGWIPEQNAVYYTGQISDVSSVNETWWMKSIKKLDMNLCINNSWSGSRVTATVSAASSGCVRRCVNLHTETLTPDVIIVYMGINDFDHNVPIGFYNGMENTSTSTMTFREAYALMLKKITTVYPEAEVFVCTLPYSNGAKTRRRLVTRNKAGETLLNYNSAIKDLAKHFQVGLIDFAECGITSENMHLYLGDYSAETDYGLHPNKYGHALLSDMVVSTLCPHLGRYSKPIAPRDK